MNRPLVIATLAAALALPSLAHAQTVDAQAADAPTADAPTKNVLDGDHVTIGVGGVYTPSYEGSNDYSFGVLPVIQGQIHGITITPRPGGLALDLIPDSPTLGDPDKKFSFSLGPVATYSRNRAHNIKDPVVLAAGRLKSAIDVGVNVGVTGYHLLNSYDSVTLSADVKWNVNGSYKGMTVLPTLSYLTPLSKAMLVTVGVSAEHVDDDYAHYYYDVSPVQSLASGLPVYNARAGWSNVSGSILVGYDLSGDLRDGGWALFGVGNYSRLLDDARRTPYTSIRGSADQFSIGAGVAYTF